MAFNRLLTVSALLVVVSLPNLVFGQVHIPSARFQPQPLEEVENTRPFAAPGVFDYDAQIFAPLEFGNGKQLGPNTGFFASFDRGAVTISNSAQNTSNNYGPTNRYSFGWMTTEDDGWEFLYEQTRASTFVNGQDDSVANPTLLRSSFANVEANRIYRQVLRNGSWIEPYVGFRFINLNETTIEDTAGVAVGGLIGGNRFRQNLTNNAFGGHVGGRYIQRRGRWRVSSDISLATTYNNQTLLATDIFSSGAVQAVNEFTDGDDAFVPAFDYRLEIGYNLTRDFGIRGGVGLVYLWDGISRASTLTTFTNPNSVLGANDGVVAGLQEDSTIAAGYSLGIEWRR